MDVKTMLYGLKSSLQAQLPSLDVEVYSRNISDYKLASQRPVGVITLEGVDYEEVLHSTIKAQKATAQVNFYYMTKSACDTELEDISAFVDAVAKIGGVCLEYLKCLSHSADTLKFELKTKYETFFEPAE